MYLRPEVCSPGARGKLLWARGRSSTDSRPRCWFCFFVSFLFFLQIYLASLINKVLPLNSLLLISFFLLSIFGPVYRLWASLYGTPPMVHLLILLWTAWLQKIYSLSSLLLWIYGDHSSSSWFSQLLKRFIFKAVPWLLAQHKAIKAGHIVFIWCCCLIFVSILQLVGICFVFVFRVSLDLWSGKQAWCWILG